MKPVAAFAICLACTPAVAVLTAAATAWWLEKHWLPKIAGED